MPGYVPPPESVAPLGAKAKDLKPHEWGSMVL